MPTQTIRKWIWGSETSYKRLCRSGPSVNLDETVWLIIPKGSYIQSATVGTKGNAENYGRVTIKLNDEQIFDKLNVWDSFEWDETIDVTGIIKPPPPKWGEGSNAFRATLAFFILKVCYNLKLYVEAVVFTPEPDNGEPPDDEEQPHWEENEKDKKLPPGLCMIAFLFGSTALSKLFPILRMFRDHVLPKMVVEGYYRLGYIFLHRLV